MSVIVRPCRNLEEILRPVDEDLARVSDAVLASVEHPIAKRVMYLISAGGKRLRPALILLAGRSGRYEAQRASLIQLAAAAELIHTATLIHDDIIDQSGLRRKQPTIHARFGTERAVLLGDLLYARAFSIAAQLQETYVMSHLAKVCEELSQGEILEVESRHNVELSEGEYLEIVRDKTASLFAACTHLGAYVAGAKDDTIANLTSFGRNLGMAFQIMDDCLDLIGEEEVVGKPLRSDLDKGSLSLPVIYLAGAVSARRRSELFDPLRERPVRQEVLSAIAKAARESGAIERALERARGFANCANEAVAVRDGLVLPETYRALAQYVTERVK